MLIEILPNSSFFRWTITKDSVEKKAFIILNFTLSGFHFPTEPALSPPKVGATPTGKLQKAVNAVPIPKSPIYEKEEPWII